MTRAGLTSMSDGESAANRPSRAVLAHRASIAEFLSLAAAIPAGRWNAPCTPGKWSAAQEVEHITLSYEVFGAELDGGVGMQPMVSISRQLVLRWIVLPFILRTGKFPGRPRAPREVRPTDYAPGKDVQLNRLRAINDVCDRSWRIARRERPRHRVSHAYFGMLGLDDALRLMTVHTRHHGRKLVSACTG